MIRPAIALAALVLVAAGRQGVSQGDRQHGGRQSGQPEIDRAAIFIAPPGGGARGFSVTRDGALRGYRSDPGQSARYARGRLDGAARDSLLQLWSLLQDSLPASGEGGRGTGYLQLTLDLHNGAGWVGAWPDTAAISYPRIAELVRFMYQHRVGGW